MSALLLASGSSDASSPGSRASTQPPRSNSSSRPPGVIGTAAYALKSFLLDEEIKLQQQRLQHMLHLRQQQLEEQNYAQLNQEIQYKHLIVQQHLLDLTGGPGLNRQALTAQELQPPPPASGRPPALLDTVPADDDASSSIKREPPPPFMQHTDKQLSLSPLQLADISETGSCTSFTVKESISVAEKGSLQQHICSQPAAPQQPPSRQDSSPHPTLRQRHNEHPPPQRNSRQQSSAHQQDIEQPAETRAAANDEFPQGGPFTQQAVNRRIYQRGQQERAPSEWPTSGALKEYREAAALTDRDEKKENGASATLETLDRVSCRTFPDAQATHAQLPLSKGGPIYRDSQQVHYEVTAVRPTDASLVQDEGLMSWKPVLVRGPPSAAGSCQGLAQLHTKSQREEESRVSAFSQGDSSLRPPKSASARSCSADGYKIPSLSTVAERACMTCEDPASPCSSPMDPEMNKGNTYMEHSSFTAAVEDNVSFGESTRAAAQCADGSMATDERAFEFQADTQDSYINNSGQPHEASVKRQGSSNFPAPATTAASSGVCAVVHGEEGGALAGQNEGASAASAADSTEGKSLLQKDKDFARLDLSLAVSQQLRSSHIPRGTDSAITQEMEEMLQRITVEEERNQCLLQPQNRARETIGVDANDFQVGSAERSGKEGRRSEDARTPSGPNSVRRAVSGSSGIRGECGDGNLPSEGSNAAQVRRLAEKLLEQETEKRLMQEEGFQLEQMLKRQYFQDIQLKEAEKEELQHQLTHTQELGKSLQQRLSDVVQQKNQLYQIVLLAQDALAEAVASTPRSSRRRKSYGLPHGSLIAVDKPSPQKVLSHAATAAMDKSRSASSTQIAGAERVDGAHSCKAEEHQLSDGEREEEEALEKLLASREEVSQTLATLMNELKHGLEAFGTYGPSKDEEAKLSASLKRAVAACSAEKEEATAVPAFCQKQESSLTEKSASDLHSDDSNILVQQVRGPTVSDDEKDSETGQQLRQLQEEVNVLRKNLKAFTEAVLASQKQYLAAVGEEQRSRRATTHVPLRRKGQEDCVVFLENGELVPPHKLTLQRLEELQRLNAKLLLDNTTLHRLYAQQAMSSPEEDALKSTYRRSTGHMPSYPTAAAARRADTSGLQHRERLSLSQSLCGVPNSVLQASKPCLKVGPGVAAAPRSIGGVAATSSPLSSGSPATPPAVVAPQRVPYCLSVGSVAASRFPTSALAHADGRFSIQKRKEAANAADVIAAKSASGAFVSETGYLGARIGPPPSLEGRQTATMLDAIEIDGSEAPRSLSPPQQPSLRRELWHTPGLTISSRSFAFTDPFPADEYRSMQRCERPEGGKLVGKRSALDHAPIRRQDHMRLGDSVTEGTCGRQTSPEPPFPPSPVSQQPLLLQRTKELQSAPGAVDVVDAVGPSWPPRIGAAQNYNNALGPRANSTRRLDGQHATPECGRHRGESLAAYTATPPAAQRAFPRLPQFQTSGKLQGYQQETAFRPAIIPSSSLSHLPLLQSCTSGSSAAQAQRQQRLRALSSVGSRIGRRLPVSQSLTLLQQHNAASQSQRTLHSRSHSQFLTRVGSPGTEASAAPLAVNSKGLSLIRSGNVARIDLTVWGQGVKHKGRTRYPGAANSAAPAARAVGSATGAVRHGTDGITPKVFHRTRRASAAVSADYFPALTPAHSDSRLLAAAEERPKRQQRGGCAFGRCWLGLSTTADKTRDVKNRISQAPNRWSHTSPSTRHLQLSPSSTEDTAHFRGPSPVPSFASWTRDHMNSLGSGVSARDSTPLMQAHRGHPLPLSPSAATAAHTTPHAGQASPVVLPLHNTGSNYANYHALASCSPAVFFRRGSQVSPSQGVSPPRSPFSTTPPVNPTGGVHIPRISLPPASVMSPPTSSSQVLYSNARISNCDPETVAPQLPLTADWLSDTSRIPDKIPAAQQLWQTNGAALN